MTRRWDLPLFALLVLGCEQLHEHVVLTPQGDTVEFAMDAPSEDLYVLLGKVEGSAAGLTENEAEQSARNELRNNAAKLGATLVLVDDVRATLLHFQSDKTKVDVKGRAFKAKE